MKHLLIMLIALAATDVARAQSLWRSERPAPAPFSDTTARGIGDILTIVIDESQTFAAGESTSLEKESSLNALLSNFDVFPEAFDTLPQVAGSASKEFEGTASVDKDNRFRTKISVLVIDVMPNGNMLVEGTRRLVVDGDKKIVRLTGLVRPYDLNADNTVKSEFVANASFSFEGTGPMNRAVNRGWFSRLLDIVWPF